MKNVSVSPNTRSLVYLVNNFLVYTQKVNGQSVPVLVLDAELEEGAEVIPSNWAHHIAEKNGKVDFLVSLHQNRVKTNN